jgi:hypothetical protein
MGQESILDRLDRDPGGARQYVATLLVVGGATRSQVADAMARKYGIPAPTGRSVTAWKNTDPELRKLIQQMEAAKRDVAPGGTVEIRPEVNRAHAVADLFAVCEQFPAFALLVHRDADREESSASTWGAPENVTPGGEDDSFHSEAMAALMEGEGMSDEEFEAHCRARLEAGPPVENAADDAAPVAA